MKTPKKIGEAIANKIENWKGRMISTTATDIEEPRTSDTPEVIEEIKDRLEVKEQKHTTVDNTTDTETDNYCTRTSIKTVKILTFTNLDVKAVKEFKMLQQNNSQMSPIISLLLK
jgi:hypothetical protein